ncbi:MAG: undecaprenyl-diphosphatase UppP [Chloroflexi bacterium]|nr:MAG: undecaprenyl-diphosphatase UppP [Chloroflexota bacterium]MBL1196178.1 undecaprenyl-diphosphatase UppP [Chloroflexota bacterium]NOH13471.1 undecaprenyl-diphosphatase UppP [Chloroflexota bacterium]
MTLLQAFILGIVQGATEFLPISSSGHLVIVPHLLNWSLVPEQAFIFDVLVQFGTMIAVLIYFWEDVVAYAKGWFEALIQGKPLATQEARMAWYLIIATLPAVVIGYLIKDIVVGTFDSVPATAWFLLGTAVLLLIAEAAGRRERDLEEITWRDALWMGLFQALALFPGVSRSGATIAGGMTRNFKRPDAARFAFLMALPVMLGASTVAVIDLANSNFVGDILGPLAVGFVTSAIVGYIAIRWLMRFLTTRPLYIFSVYCTVIGLVALFTS